MKNTQKHININNKKNKKITKIKKMRGGGDEEIIDPKDTLKNLLTQIIKKRNKKRNNKRTSYNTYNIIPQLEKQSIKIYVLDKENSNNISKFSSLTKGQIKKEFDNYLLTNLVLITKYLDNDKYNNIILASKIVYGKNNIYLVILDANLFNSNKKLQSSSVSTTSTTSNTSNGSNGSNTSNRPNTSSISSEFNTYNTSRNSIGTNASNLKTKNNITFNEIMKLLGISLPVAWEIKNILGLSILECISAGNFFKNNKQIKSNIVQKIFDDTTLKDMDMTSFITKIRITISDKIDSPQNITERDKKILNKIVDLSKNKSIKEFMINNGLITDDDLTKIIEILGKVVNEIAISVNANDVPVNPNAIAARANNAAGNNAAGNNVAVVGGYKKIITKKSNKKTKKLKKGIKK